MADKSTRFYGSEIRKYSKATTSDYLFKYPYPNKCLLVCDPVRT